MKVLGIVILYYPDQEVIQNISSYINCVDKLIVWENTPLDEQRSICFDPCVKQKIMECGVGRNVGIGIPLNEAVQYGLTNSFTHLLTMDQDSCFGENMFPAYLQSIAIIHDKEKEIASFSANTHTYEELTPEIEDIDICITSGTIYRLDVFKNVGTFRDDFFIDAIDTEFCFRLRRKGFKMLQLNKIFMHHVLGDVTVTPFLWGKLISPNYSAQRTYYLIRNSLILKKKYPEYRQSANHFKTILFWRAICIVFVESDKWNKFKAMLLGIYHSMIMKAGEYAIK